MEDWESISSEFCCSETMRHELKQCLKYAEIIGVDIKDILRSMRDKNELPCPDKKTGIKRLKQFRDRICDGENTLVKTTGTRGSTLDTGLIYIEKRIREHPRTEQIVSRFPTAKIQLINSYKDVYYNHSGNENNNGKTYMILAEKTDETILPGAPVCQDFDERYFYYTSSAKGCLYDCEYCYLKGMHPSRDLLIYVNIEDIFRDLEKLLTEHGAYVCLSYDTDLMVLEDIAGYVSLWMDFTQKRPALLAECRTKCARNDLWEKLTPCDRMIFAFTLSPDEVIRAFEHRTPTLMQRLRSAKEAMEKGFTVRLCFDPILRIPGWRDAYARMVRTVADELDMKKVRDISVGTFRISQDYLKRIRLSEPDSAAVQYPFLNEAGVYGYPEEERSEMMGLVMDMLKDAASDIPVVAIP